MQPKILIVEDEFIVALHLKNMLTMLGFEIVGIAPDEATALALAAKKPDIAFVDINLRDGPTGPRIGTELARTFGASVLFVTANPRQLNNVDSGAVGVMSKPFNDNEIGPVLDFMVSHRQGCPIDTPRNVTLL